MRETEAPVKYGESVSALKEVYDALKGDVAKLHTKSVDLGVARLVLSNRRAQLRTVEIALAAQRLFMNYKNIEEGNGAGKRRRRAD